MGASNSTSSNVKFYSLKAKTSNEETPHFALTEKVDGAWKTTGTYDTLTGCITKAEIKEKEWNGTKFNAFLFTLNDGQEESRVEMTHNSITHNLINSLASDCNVLDEYSFVLRKKQVKAGNGKMYWNGTCYVNVKGKEKGLSWSIDMKATPKKEPVMVPDGKGGLIQFQQAGKGVWDDSKVKAFWENIFITKIMPAVNVPRSNANAMPSTIIPDLAGNSSNGFDNSPTDNDDMPF